MVDYILNYVIQMSSNRNTGNSVDCNIMKCVAPCVAPEVQFKDDRVSTDSGEQGEGNPGEGIRK